MNFSTNQAMFQEKNTTAWYGYETDCLNEMERNGIPFKGPLCADEKIHRFSMDSKKLQKDEWYVAFKGVSFKGNDYLICIYGSWSTQEKHEYRSFAKNGRTFDEKERQHLHDVLCAKRETAEKILREEHEQAAVKAQKIWNASLEKPQSEQHTTYLRSKGVDPVGVRFGNNPQGYPSMVIPLKNIDGEIRSLQFISTDDDGRVYKTFLQGGEKRGNFHVLGELGPHTDILVAEGYSTAAALFKVKHPVVMAGDCGNLESVVAAIRSRYTECAITIAADDDRETEGNPGRTKAEETAKKYACALLVPEFTAGKDRGPSEKCYTDFNDLMRVSGIEVVKQQILSATAVQTPNPAPNWLEPKPIRTALHPVPAFDPQTLLPCSLRDWIMDESERMQAPPEFIAVAAIVALGSVIGARCGIRPKHKDSWAVVPNLWGGIVGDPSVKKTPAVNSGAAALGHLIASAQRDYEEAIASFEVEKIKHTALQDGLEARIKTKAKEKNKKSGGEEESLDSLLLELKKHKQNAPVAPIIRRYKSNDVTVEKLGEILRDNPTGLLIFRDELVGLLASWDKAGHEGDRTFYLESWSGDSNFNVDRIGRGSIFIPNLCISVLGGIQPDKLIEYLEGHSHTFANDGLLQRFQLLVYPDPPDWKWVDNAPNIRARERAYAIFDKLAHFDPLAQKALPPDAVAKIPCFQFIERAQEIFIEWTSNLHKEKIPKEENLMMAQHLAKYDKLFPALALIFHLAVENGGPVSEEAALLAKQWCDFLEEHARRCYGLLADAGLQAAQTLCEKLSQGLLQDGFTARDIKRRKWKHLSAEKSVNAGLEWLEDEGWIRANKVGGTGPGSGRSTFRYSINPKIPRKYQRLASSG